jgi:hypothetical protein
MDNNSKPGGNVQAGSGAGRVIRYTNAAALFAAGTTTTYFALRSDGYSFFQYLAVFAGIYLPIAGLGWLYAKMTAKKQHS